MMKVQPLPEHEVHVWWLRDRGRADHADLLRLEGVLQDDERTRRGQIALESDRRQFMLTRGMVRLLLSRYLGRDPRALRFGTNAWGKPFVRDVPEPFEFNVSHTRGLIACALGRRQGIGVDVECVERTIRGDLAEHVFARDEAAALRVLEGAEFTGRFLDIWTLKEAYIKARGMGVSLPLHDFSVTPRPGGTARIEFRGAIDDLPEHWQVMQLDPGEDYRMALAVRRYGRDPDVRFGELTLQRLS